jgi:hypothetical protein
MKRLAVLTCLVLGLMVLGAPALAERPPHAAPPEVEVVPLEEDDEPIFCNDRVLQFTEGEVVARFRLLPGDRGQVTAYVRDGRAVDVDDGTEFRVHGAARFMFTLDDESGMGLFSLTFVGPRGEVLQWWSDFEKTVAGALTSMRFTRQGQSCTAASRSISSTLVP